MESYDEYEEKDYLYHLYDQALYLPSTTVKSDEDGEWIRVMPNSFQRNYG